MEDARKLRALGFPPGTVVAAGSQSQGRGRFPERRWEAEEGSSLLATLILDREAGTIPGFPLRMGLAACRAVDLFCLQTGGFLPSPPRLKWPNDILIDDRKVSGILCEAAGAAKVAGADPASAAVGSEAVYAGFGVNLNQKSFPAGLRAKALSLSLALKRQDRDAPLDPFRLLEILLDQIQLVLHEDGWREEAAKVLWRQGEPVRFLEGLPERNQVLEGRIIGIGPTGALLIRVEGERRPRSLVAGELVHHGTVRVDRIAPDHIR